MPKDLGDLWVTLGESTSLRNFDVVKAFDRATVAFANFIKSMGPSFAHFRTHAEQVAYFRSVRNSPAPYGYLRLSRGRGMSTQNRKVNKHGRIGVNGRVYR